MVEATFLIGENAQKVHFDSKLYAVVNYQDRHKLVAMYKMSFKGAALTEQLNSWHC